MADILAQYREEQTNSLKGFLKTKTNAVKALQTQDIVKNASDEEKAIVKEVISQITTAMNVGSKPKREDYLTAGKELTEIQQTLTTLAEQEDFDPGLMNLLNRPTVDGQEPTSATGIALNFIKVKQPSLPGAAAMGAVDKMKAVSGGFLKTMAMDIMGGIPFGGAIVDWASEKVGGAVEGIGKGKKLTETELGVGRAFSPGGASDEFDEENEENGEPGADGADGADGAAEANGGESSSIKKTKETGGKSEIVSIQAETVNLQTGAIAEGEVAEAGGEVVTPAPIAGVVGDEEGGIAEIAGGEVVGDEEGGIAEIAGGEVAAGEGMSLDTTNEILTEIEEHLQFMADNMEDSETRRERVRGEKAGGVVSVGKGTAGPKDEGGGLFGKFNFMDIFKKGGIKKLITTLGGTLFGGLTTAFGSTGMVGKSLLAKLGPGLMKVAGPAALLAGIALAVKDGMMGYAKSEEWGVSKFSGTLGGILGGEDKGLKGAMWGGMKWALIGAGIGSVFPVVGTVIGGALGALLGAILGYFGGEKIAQAIDKMGAWFNEKWNGFLSIFGLGDDKVTAEAEKKASKGKQDIDKKRLEFTEKEIKRLESKDEPLSEEQQTRLEGLKVKAKKLGGTIKEREISSGEGGSGLTIKQREKELKELTASREDTTGWFKGDVKGIEESEDELVESKEDYEETKIRLEKKWEAAHEGIDPYGNFGKIRESHPQFEEFVAEYIKKAEGMIARNEAAWKEKQDAHQWMIDRKALLLKEDQAAKDAGLKVKLQEGGIVPGEEGEPVPVLAHGKEIFFDNESSERMHKVASLLEGTDFKSMEELFYNAKESAGYKALMDNFLTSEMLESKHGGMLKNVSMLFGLAGHGQLGKTKKHGTIVDKFSMGPETIMNLFEKLNYFKERGDYVRGEVEEGRGGKGRARNISELNAVRAIQEISKSMALLGDSPEEKEALDRYEKMTMEEKILSEMSREEAEERGQALKIDLKQRWDNVVKSETDRTKRIDESFVNFGKAKYDTFAESMTPSRPQTGTQLNAAAMDRVGYEGGKSTIAPTVIDASTVQNVSNNTLIRPPSPPGPLLPGERGDF